VRVGYTHILRITDSAGDDLVEPYVPTPQDTVVSPQAAYVMTDILQSNTDPDQNPIWGDFALRGPNGDRRPATIKTGTSQDANDLVAFGYIPPTDDGGRTGGEYSLVVGAWVGNSDGSPVLTEENPVLSTDVAAPMWHGFLQEVTGAWPVRGFARPPGIVEADVDAWSGMAPTEFTRQTVREVFIDGTVPPADTTKVALQVVVTGEQEVPPAGEGEEQQEPQPRFLIWAEGCAPPETRGFLALEGVEAGHPDWQAANLDWINRARSGGPGTPGGPDPEQRTRTSYIFNRGYTPYGRSWGAPFAPTDSCVPGASPSPSLSLEPSPSLSPSLEITPEPTIEITPPPVVTEPPPPPPTEPPPPPPTEPPPPPPPTEPPPPPPTVDITPPPGSAAPV
jgi:membrane peptidoglycan carboxypeptidase